MAEKAFSRRKNNIETGYFDDFDKSGSFDPINEENIDYEEWTKYISFYRHHIDLFAVQ